MEGPFSPPRESRVHGLIIFDIFYILILGYLIPINWGAIIINLNKKKITKENRQSLETMVTDMLYLNKNQI